MKRFFCTICQRVKRVRNLPRNVIRVESASVGNREGTCDKHFNTDPSQRSIKSAQPITMNYKRKGA